jgi:selenide,water dikinase
MRGIDASDPGAAGAGKTAYRLTQFAHGGGCACKIPPGELEEILSGLATMTSSDLVVGVEHGDDAAVFRVREGLAVVSTADFFTPVVDDAYDWGRIAAANAFSDVYAMGGRPVLAINLVGWPRDVLPMELLREVLRGGLDVGVAAGAPIAGGHSIDDPEPKYGLAVTGLVDPERLMRIGAARAGLPISLTKPLGVGMLNNRHKATGDNFPQAVASMVALNDIAARDALAAGVEAATDVTGFGLLGHLYKMARASWVSALLEVESVVFI